MLIAEECAIADGVKIMGPAVLGARCKVATGAVVEGALSWPDSKVGRGAVLKNCIVASNSHVQEGSQSLDNWVPGNNVTIGGGDKLAQGAGI